MPVAKPTVKSLRAAAKSADIDGWEEMDREELEEALAEVDEETEEDIEDEEIEDDSDDSDEDDDEDDDDDEDEAPAPRRTAKAKTAVSKAPAKKAAAKKAPAKKVVDEPNENGNPYRKDSNLYHITEALMKGGKRSVMVTRLLKKIDLKPRVKGGKDYDEAAELDYRIVRACQDLKNSFGFVIEREGRGAEQKVKAVAPQDQ